MTLNALPIVRCFFLPKIYFSPVVLAILIELFMISLLSAAISTSAIIRREGKRRTLLNVTLGTMVVCNALGASLTPLLGSPPGWY